LAHRGGQLAAQNLQKHSVSEKISAVKEHPHVAKVAQYSDKLLAVLGVAMLFHGVHFKNLFLCSQVMMLFCFSRVKSSILALQTDITAAYEKIGEDTKTADAKAEAKPEAKKGASEREADAAAAKKVLKVLDSKNVSSTAFELCVSAMACHMVMEGGLARVAVLTHFLVKSSRDKIASFLHFAGHDDVQAWIDTLLSLVLYISFGFLALIMRSWALALSIALCGAEIATANGLRIAEAMGRIPGGATAESFATSLQGRCLLCGLCMFGTLWQFWTLMAESDMALYFKVMYCPACIAEYFVAFL